MKLSASARVLLAAALPMLPSCASGEVSPHSRGGYRANTMFAGYCMGCAEWPQVEVPDSGLAAETVAAADESGPAGLAKSVKNEILAAVTPPTALRLLPAPKPTPSDASSPSSDETCHLFINLFLLGAVGLAALTKLLDENQSKSTIGKRNPEKEVNPKLTYEFKMEALEIGLEIGLAPTMDEDDDEYDSIAGTPTNSAAMSIVEEDGGAETTPIRARNQVLERLVLCGWEEEHRVAQMLAFAG